MAKGKLKRKKGHFVNRNEKWRLKQDASDRIETNNTDECITKRIRLSKEEYQAITKECNDVLTINHPTSEKATEHYRLLRPNKDKGTTANANIKHSNFNGMRLVDFNKVTIAFNTAYKEHAVVSAECREPELCLLKEIKWGLSWKIALKCKSCLYESSIFKLYEEVNSCKRGAKSAAVNVSFGVGLQDTPIGNKRARLLLASMNTSPPSKSAMQKTANKVGKAIVAINEKDMAEKLSEVRKANVLRGTDPQEIAIAMDGRYNSTCIASRKKPGQNASQAIGIAIENVTNKNYIVSASVQNKLCWEGAWLRGRGLKVSCPGGHAGCTANLSGFAPLSEYNMGQEIAQRLFKHGFKIKHLTTDGDSKSSDGVRDKLQGLDQSWQLERHLDPTHMGQVQFRRCNNANFSTEMFPGCVTKERLSTLRRVLSQDIKARCSLILKELMKTHSGDMAFLEKKLPEVLEATLLCYCGDCSKCLSTQSYAMEEL